jgi:hypothetical protein
MVALPSSQRDTRRLHFRLPSQAVQGCSPYETFLTKTTILARPLSPDSLRSGIGHLPHVTEQNFRFLMYSGYDAGTHRLRGDCSTLS